MSPIGRIFIVLNLVLAVAFLGWASSALANSQEWKTKFQALETTHTETVATLEGERDSEIQLKVAATNDRDNLQTQLSNADSSNTQLKADKADLQERLNGLQASLDKISTEMQDYDNRNQELADDISRLTNERVAAIEGKATFQRERDNLENEKNQLERDLKVANDTIAAQERTGENFKQEISDLNTLIATAQEIYQIDFRTLMAQPHISGAVLMVSSEVAPGLVSINRGTADSVKRGYSFEIYSGGQYKGRVRVINVQENQCTAIVEKTYDGRAMEQGDSASTHI
jgi:predicted  nucleic acid-binding Zn-ribbon protein